MRAWRPEILAPPTIPELETTLGRPVSRMTLLGHNWRNRVYRIEMTNGDAVLAKQGLMSTDSMLEFQRKELDRLGALKIQGLYVPAALGLMAERRILLMEFAFGETIEALMWNRELGESLRQSCILAGEILAQLERARTEKMVLLPVDALAQDLALAPWSFSRSQEKLLAKSFGRLAGVELRLGEVFYDYKAANLIFKQGVLNLIDPPDLLRSGILLWDFACFRSSMRRHLWRLMVRRPGRARRSFIQRCQRSFEEAYFSNLDQPQLDVDNAEAVVHLLELQRTGLLMTMQQGKVELSQRGDPIAQGNRLGSMASNRLTLPLLEIEKRWLFRQLRQCRLLRN